jgi:hypothetical protein
MLRSTSANSPAVGVPYAMSVSVRQESAIVGPKV